jgi:hydroxyacylglutathione hydrolase
VTRLARVGYDHAIGYLKGGFEAWKASGKETDHIRSVSAEQLASVLRENQVNILDVRRKSEFDSEHLEDAENAPLDYINESMLKVKKDETTYVHCAGGYRSMTFISILKARGYDKLVDVGGGFKAIRESGRFRTTNYIQPTTEL